MDRGEFYAGDYYQGLVRGFDAVESPVDEAHTNELRQNPRAIELGTFFGEAHFGVNYACATCRDTGKVAEQVLWSDGWGMATKRCPDCK